MGVHEAPWLALQRAVEIELNLAGVGCEHVIGERGRANLGKPPRYVWVPTRGRKEPARMTPNVTEYRTLFGCLDEVEIDCWGVSFDQADAMAQNALKAIYDNEVVSADLEGYAWHRPSSGIVQSGECLTLTVSINRPFVDVYVPLDTLAEDEAPTVVPARIEGDLYLTDSVDADGEEQLIVSTSDP